MSRWKQIELMMVEFFNRLGQMQAPDGEGFEVKANHHQGTESLRYTEKSKGIRSKSRPASL